MGHVSQASAFVVRVARVTARHELKYPAAALAYYAFVSQIPLLTLVVAGTSDRLVTRIQATAPTFLTPETGQLMSDSLSTASGRTGAALLAVGVLAWSGANIVTGFQTVIERVEPRASESRRTQLRDAGSILVSLGLVIVAILLTNLVFALHPIGHALASGQLVVQFATLTVAFLPLYYMPSCVVTSLRGALPGALTAALGWTVLLALIQVYSVNASQYAVYGVLSGIIIILTSLYVAAVVLMIGVVVNTLTTETADSPGTPRI